MDQDYFNFIRQIKRSTGIDLALYKEAQMKRRLTSLYKKRGFHSFNEFYQSLSNDSKLMDEFLDRMTINVTEFYRNKNRWEVLENHILPRLISGKRRLKVWSSAASTGEEPYTLAMVLSQFFPLHHISILATDIDEQALETAKMGVYPERAITGIPMQMMTRFLRKEGQVYKVTDELKQTVQFKRLNLLGDPFDSGFDLIICRNVLIYFTEEAKDQLYWNFSKALSDDGVLFVGSTEQIFNYHQYGFDVEESFFYKKTSSRGGIME